MSFSSGDSAVKGNTQSSSSSRCSPSCAKVGDITSHCLRRKAALLCTPHDDEDIQRRFRFFDTKVLGLSAGPDIKGRSESVTPSESSRPIAFARSIHTRIVNVFRANCDISRANASASVDAYSARCSSSEMDGMSRSSSMSLAGMKEFEANGGCGCGNTLTTVLASSLDRNPPTSFMFHSTSHDLI